MHIKNILISGFRSYREQTFHDELSPKNNVIVGKNGSGKSNFFAAVQFVLCEKFSSLSGAQRKDLFHVGAGRPALSIFVEIVFDNSDLRLVIPGRADEREVRIRRTVGLKQDEFRVNDRRFTAAEVRQLLESAGFSSTNPYYIVEQGQIAALANMSDEDRCRLIKDVAGTRIYELRRKESEETLKDTVAKHRKIEESIAQLQKRLNDLEMESAELNAFQDADKERKCVEYCIFMLELASAKESLQKLDEKRSEYVTFLNENSDSNEMVKTQIQELEAKIRSCAVQIAQLDTESKTLEREKDVLINRKTVIQLDTSDAEKTLSRNAKENIALQKEMDQLQKKVCKINNDLLTKRAILTKQQSVVDGKNTELFNMNATLETLQARRGRHKLFKSKNDRNDWLQGEIYRNQNTIEAHQREVLSIDENIEGIEKQIQDEDEQNKKRESITKNREMNIIERESKRSKVASIRNNLNIERRNLWQKINEHEVKIQSLQDEYNRSRHDLERAIPYDIRQGLQSLQEVLHETRDDRLKKAVHGQVIELINVAKGYETAVEVTAGSSLFNVVIETFDASNKILEQMNKRKKPGRISFIPLDTCKSTSPQFADSADFKLISEHVSCDSHFTPVVTEMFGRTVVVNSIEDGARAVKQLNCDAVTLEGDQCSRKGGITGGHVDTRRLKISSFAREKNIGCKLSDEKKVLEDLCQQVAVVEQKITETINEIELLAKEAVVEDSKTDAELHATRFHDERKMILERQREQFIAARRILEKNIEDTQNAVKALEKEIQEDFDLSWCPNDEKHLERLMAEINQAQSDVSKLELQNVQLATEVQLLEDTHLNASRRLAIVGDRIRELGWAANGKNALASEANTLDDDIAHLSERIKVLRGTMDTLTKQKHASEVELEGLKNKHFSSSISIQERKDNAERIQIQRYHYIQQRDDALEKIRRLGIVPNNGVEKYSGLPLSMLIHRLKQINEIIQKYTHVNRKAVDQYSLLLETKNNLVSQQENLQKELESIKELMDHLDRKKDEAVERTYKQLQFQFEQVFKELVATENCHGELQLIRSATKKEAGEDPYVAARILVSFGLGTAVTDLKQLSGGQKSLVALALIFAIQRCDPAPFYLFDEIDAALDAEYRASVAKMLRKESEKCQFITATFKNEMLEVADRVLGVFFHNKVSRIQAITKDEGAQLLKQAVLEERKRVREAEG
ncbi:structural maintenance of chromosome 3 protein [Trypanosoma vivax]|nr:structural maintenance of chromosome 3 protein [Trypanosoma vivax]